VKEQMLKVIGEIIHRELENSQILSLPAEVKSLAQKGVSQISKTKKNSNFRFNLILKNNFILETIIC
jgi:hypothetical protein